MIRQSRLATVSTEYPLLSVILKRCVGDGDKEEWGMRGPPERRRSKRGATGASSHVGWWRARQQRRDDRGGHYDEGGDGVRWWLEFGWEVDRADPGIKFRGF